MDNLQKLYQVLKETGLITSSYNDFARNMSDDSYKQKVFKTVTQGNTMPTLSCGMHPGLVHSTIGKVGSDFIANVGGAIHSHPGGTLAGAKAMRQALDDMPGPEFRQAVNKWGLQ